jgi:hypothetical protein
MGKLGTVPSIFFIDTPVYNLYNREGNDMTEKRFSSHDY